jgi:hypothetical protein
MERWNDGKWGKGKNGRREKGKMGKRVVAIQLFDFSVFLPL